MTPDMTVDIFRQALWVAIAIMGVLIVPGLLVGLIVAMFQAATQINEASLSFIPKLFVTFMALMIGGPWILKILIGFTQKLFNDIPFLIG